MLNSIGSRTAWLCPQPAALPVVAHEVNHKIYPVSSSETLLALVEEEEPVSFLH